MIQDGNDSNETKRQPESETNDRQKGTGTHLLEAMRLLIEMVPEERMALIELLKALDCQ